MAAKKTTNNKVARNLKKDTKSTKTEAHKLEERGNLFVICTYCTSMIVISTGADDIGDVMPGWGSGSENAIVFSSCYHCPSLNYGNNQVLSSALFTQPKILETPKRILGREVTLMSTAGDKIHVFDFMDDIMLHRYNWRIWSIEEPDDDDPDGDFKLLPYFDGRFLSS